METLSDHLLISMPHMSDAYFAESVIYICEYHDAGCMGLVINRPLQDFQTQIIIDALGLDDENDLKKFQRLYYGGPVQPNHGLVLHTTDYTIEDTLHISGRASLTATPKVLQDIRDGNGPDEFRLTWGYAGWGTDQLEREIANGDWLVIPAEKEMIFNSPDESKWEIATGRFGIEIRDFSGPGGSA